MINPETINDIRSAPVEDRIHAIERILDSVKKDVAGIPKTGPLHKRFKIRTLPFIWAKRSMWIGERFTRIIAFKMFTIEPNLLT